MTKMIGDFEFPTEVYNTLSKESIEIIRLVSNADIVCISGKESELFVKEIEQIQGDYFYTYRKGDSVVIMSHEAFNSFSWHFYPQ